MEGNSSFIYNSTRMRHPIMTVIGMIGGGKHCFAAPTEMVEGKLERIQTAHLKEDVLSFNVSLFIILAPFPKL